jgi:hypothetical protein
MLVRKWDQSETEGYVPLRISTRPRRPRDSRNSKRAKNPLPATRLVLIGDRFWYLPAAKAKAPRRTRRIIGAAFGVTLVAGLLAANVLLFR